MKFLPKILKFSKNAEKMKILNGPLVYQMHDLKCILVCCFEGVTVEVFLSS